MVPMPIERSECPPDFSLRIITATHLAGSRLSPASFSSDFGSAFMRRGMKRARICAPQAYRPVELNAKPVTGFPSRTTSVITATTDVVISEKSIEEFFSVEFSAMEVSRMSVMRMPSS